MSDSVTAVRVFARRVKHIHDGSSFGSASKTAVIGYRRFEEYSFWGNVHARGHREEIGKRSLEWESTLSKGRVLTGCPSAPPVDH
ncbi:hypothetical protein CEXT_746671 [Caerostris extrusa]|uniref:Uncharacterized protein n=1 Tax=Caerostris extrusa TaxID=172846 RepID=A0AAV4YDM5_CAEEX|nr:hypothetical protein CEXT_746671 [Caerostris extrusa]